MTRKGVQRILEDKIDYIKATHQTAINTNNGILNDEFLAKEKKLFFRLSTEYLVEQYIDSLQYYPENDISDVELDIDVVIMRREDFEKIKNYIYEQEGEGCRCGRCSTTGTTEVESTKSV